MRTEFVRYLCCPKTGESLKLTVFTQKGQHVTAGLLRSQNSWYPIIDGVPRLLIGELKVNLLQTHQDFLKKYRSKLDKAISQEWQSTIDSIADLDAFWRHQKKTAESFAYEWKTIYRENDFEKNNFFHFLSPFINATELKGKLTLDIGCGSGRFTKQAALAGAAVAFGSDLGESVEVAYQLTKDLPNACIVQADIYDMPFRQTFDVAYSIGVLHHLPRPEAGFRRLPKVLKPDGRMLIWVYSRRHNGRAIYFYEPLRAALKHLPKPLLYRLCYLPAFGVQLINYLTVGLGKLGFDAAAKKVPFYYYANFPFNMKLNDAFDVLATPKSNYYYLEEIERWFKNAKLKQVHAYEHREAGITCVGSPNR